MNAHAVPAALAGHASALDVMPGSAYAAPAALCGAVGIEPDKAR